MACKVWQHPPDIKLFHIQVVIADVGDKDSTYNDFLAVLPPSDCRYGGMTTHFSALTFI